MNKTYLVDGKPYEVGPSKEQQFLEDFKDQNPILKDDELGKSDGASPPQILPTKNKDLAVDLTTGEVISKAQQKKITELQLDDGSLESLEGKSIFNFNTEDKSFFKGDSGEIIEKSQEVFGDIFSYEKLDNDKIKITHNESKNSTIFESNIDIDYFKKDRKKDLSQQVANINPFIKMVDRIAFDMSVPLDDKKKALDKAVEDNSKNLYDFIQNNLKDYEYGIVENNQKKLIDDYKLLQTKGQPLHVEQTKLDEVFYKYSDTDKSGNPINQDIFKTKEEERVVVSRFSGDKITTTVQPYEEELEEAKQLLMRSNVKNPSQERIQSVARNILINKEKDALYDQKFNEYMNSDEVEGKDGIINKIKIAAQLSSSEDAKALLKYDNVKKAKINDIESSKEFANIKNFRDVVGNKYNNIKIEEGEEAVELENGKVVPKTMYDAYVRDLAITKSRYDDLDNWLEENNKSIEKLEDSKYKNDLVQRNYDDFEKFRYNIGSGFDRILVGGTYGLTKGLGAIVGIDSSKPDNIKLDYDEASRIYANEFQKDIEFKNAFKSTFNFGKFVAQEFGNQIPIFATLAIPYVGIPALGVSSAGDNWSRMVKEDRESGSNTSTFKKFAASAGYGAAEVVFDRWITRANMYRAFRGLQGGGRQLVDEGLEGMKFYFKNNTFKAFVQTPLSEVASESFTTITQNVITGRPITENLGHAAFSGGMFGGVFGGAPFMKGVFMNKFSTNENRRAFQDNSQKITDLEQELLWAKEAGVTKEVIETIENDILDLKSENQTIFEAEKNKANNLPKESVEAMLESFTKSESYRLKAREINNDKKLDGRTRKKLLDDLTKKYNQELKLQEILKDPKVFGNRFRIFGLSNKEEDKQRREIIFQEAYNNLVRGDSNSFKRKIISDPTQDQINNEARLIYNLQEINKDFKNKTKTGFGKRFKNYNSVEKAIFEIQKMNNISEQSKAELIEELNLGSHGANVPTIDPNTGKNTGKFFKFQVAENMAKDDRLTTRTHELGHDVLSEIIGSNPEAFRPIAEQILEYTRKNNPALYIKLSSMSRGLPIDEILTNYMELVVESDLRSEMNEGLGPIMAWMFGNTAKQVADVDFNFEGETDAVRFITELARKIKSGEVNIKSLKDSFIAEQLKQSEEAKKVVSSTKYSDAISKSNQQIAARNEELFNKIKRDAKVNGIALDEVYYEETVDEKGKPKRIKFYKAVSDRVRGQLIENNMATSNKLAKIAYEGGVASGTKRVSLDDFQAGFYLQLSELGRTWNPAEGVPFGAYVNGLLPGRYNQILESIKGQGPETRSISTAEGDIDIADTDVAVGGGGVGPVETGKFVADFLDIKRSDIQDVTDKADLSKIQKDPSYKRVKNETKTGSLKPTLKLVGDKAGVSANKLSGASNLTNTERAKARKFIFDLGRNNNIMKTFMPEGTDASGKSTGIANTSLGSLYRKGTRVKAAKTGSAQGLPEQIKRSNVPNQEVFDLFGMDSNGNEIKNISEVGDGKKTQFDGAIREFIINLASLANNQQIRVDNPGLQAIGDPKPEIMFSKKVDNIINIQDSFELETRGIDKLFSSFKVDEDFIDLNDLQNTFNIKTEEGRKQFIEQIKTNLFPMFPKEFFFTTNKQGEVTADVFTYSNANYNLKRSVYKDKDKKNKLIPKGKKVGDFKFPEQAKMYEGFKNEIRALANDTSIKFGKDIVDSKGKKVNLNIAKSYNTIFGNKDNFIDKIKNNKKAIDNWNESVGAIHKEMWSRFNSAINNDNTENKLVTRVIGTYLKLTANDKQSWHRLGAQMTGYSKSLTKRQKGESNIEFEHAMPATAAYLYLLDAAIDPTKNFEASYNSIIKNYKLIVLDKAMDDKLRFAKTERGYSLRDRMPDNWSVVDGSWWQRYFNELVVGVDGIGINPNSIIGLDGKTLGQTLGVNSSGDPAVIKMSRKNINKINSAVEAFNKQAELIKKQNKAIQADLEKRGYTFVEKSKFSKKGQTPSEMIKIMQADLEARGYEFVDMNKKGMSTFDFDETVGVSENFVIAKKGNDVQRIASSEWPFVGEDLAAQGYEFDFSDFNKVTKGKPGPLFEKMKNQIKKYGPENVFILTARAPQSEQAIHDWLASNGINIPRKNVTGLGNSTGQAKADWMLEKFAEGYNDMYFVDDALPNVEAVKNVLEQLDIKSKVVQAKIKFSRKAPLDLNVILEQTKGIPAEKRFSTQEARKVGIGKGRLKFFVPPSAEDFKGLVYSFLGRGREGDAHAAWFKKHLFDPFAKGIRQWNTYKQAMSDDYQVIKKQFKTVGKKLNKKVPGTVFTNDNAIRVYLWNKAGFEIPGITESQIEKLVNHVNNNSDLKNFADALGVISRVPEGYVQPEGYWAVQSIASDLSNAVLKAGRKDFLAEWIENKNIIFSEQNLNKIEAIYGTDFRDALENMLYRMETGTNRPAGKSKQVNMWLDWINGSVAATMFINVRSAALQTISTVNFINMADNNILKASLAFANQPQYWKDFAFIFNSPMLKQRRAGLQMDISASEITRAFNQGKSRPEAILAYLLEKGFLPTQIADSFAISAGGAAFYRNRIKTYLKQGMSEIEARKQAFLDFQEVAEETQQSSRPDLISMQQAGPMGRLILAWQNTPMQMTRLTKKKISDLVKRRRIPGYTQVQSDMANIQGILYYGVIQNLIFGAMQTGLMFLLFGWDEDEERKRKLEVRVANGALDTLLRGTGIYGAAISTLKNVLWKWHEERQKPGWKRDDWNIMQEAVNLSPPIGSKMRKIMSAVRTEKYNKGVSKEIGFRIENPNLSIAANWTEALTNIPVARVISKANNVEEALNSNNDIWQRVALVSGWSRWSVGVEDEELKAAKESVKEKKEKKKKQEREKKKKEKKKKQPKKFRCRKTKSDYTRCKNMTSHSSQYCYAHR
jgi:hypothetical protein